MDFEWDPDKNAANIDKHHVSFEVAIRAWLDPCKVGAEDRAHSAGDEPRYLLFGKVGGRVLTVC